MKRSRESSGSRRWESWWCCSMHFPQPVWWSLWRTPFISLCSCSFLPNNHMLWIVMIPTWSFPKQIYKIVIDRIRDIHPWFSLFLIIDQFLWRLPLLSEHTRALVRPGGHFLHCFQNHLSPCQYNHSHPWMRNKWISTQDHADGSALRQKDIEFWRYKISWCYGPTFSAPIAMQITYQIQVMHH